MPRRYLLSIDGGGIRGIIPAVALAKLEATTGRPARETFSFAAGTRKGNSLEAGGDVPLYEALYALREGIEGCRDHQRSVTSILEPFL
jgi:hypothetical protein